MPAEQIATEYNKKWNEAVDVLVASIVYGRYKSKKIIEDKVVAILKPIIDEMFSAGLKDSKKTAKDGINGLIKKYGVDIKYDKNFLSQINEVSIFTGYADKAYKDLYTKSEIEKIKKIILSAKYSGWDEQQTKLAIQKAVKMSNRRALLLARTETQRLSETAKKIYMSNKKVADKYVRVWKTRGDNKVRPSHRRMDGKEADSNGQFHSPDVGLINGPGAGPTEFSINCRCKTILKQKKNI